MARASPETPAAEAYLLHFVKKMIWHPAPAHARENWSTAACATSNTMSSG